MSFCSLPFHHRIKFFHRIPLPKLITLCTLSAKQQQNSSSFRDALFVIKFSSRATRRIHSKTKTFIYIVQHQNMLIRLSEFTSTMVSAYLCCFINFSASASLQFAAHTLRSGIFVYRDFRNKHTSN